MFSIESMISLGYLPILIKSNASEMTLFPLESTAFLIMHSKSQAMSSLANTIGFAPVVPSA